MVVMAPWYDADGEVALWHVLGDDMLVVRAAVIAAGAKCSPLNFVMDLKVEELSESIEDIVPLPPSRIVISVRPEDVGVPGVAEALLSFKQRGYKILLQGVGMDNIQDFKNVLRLADIMMIKDTSYVSMIHQMLSQALPNLEYGCDSIHSIDDIEDIQRFCSYYCGPDFAVGEFCQDVMMQPMSYNYAELISVVNTENVDFGKVSDVVEKDPSLSVNMVSMANRVAANKGIKSVRQAAAMLGQRELKRWINVTVVQEMCTDTPGEVMRTSLMRARFMENLGPQYGFGKDTAELFLCGLFSNVDIILNKPMEEALDEVGVSNDIRQAIMDRAGKYGNLYTMVRAYETGDWVTVNAVPGADGNVLTQCYIDTLEWYCMVVAG